MIGPGFILAGLPLYGGWDPGLARVSFSAVLTRG